MTRYTDLGRKRAHLQPELNYRDEISSHVIEPQDDQGPGQTEVYNTRAAKARERGNREKLHQTDRAKGSLVGISEVDTQASSSRKSLSEVEGQKLVVKSEKIKTTKTRMKGHQQIEKAKGMHCSWPRNDC